MYVWPEMLRLCFCPWVLSLCMLRSSPSLALQTTDHETMSRRHHSASIPLAEALPWPKLEPEGQCFLVCDSLQTNGRFLSYTLTSQVLVSKAETRILWISCGPNTERLILNGLKRMDVPFNGGKEQRLHIRCVPSELSQHVLQDSDKEDNHNVDVESFMKNLYKDIQTWAATNSSTGGWLVIEDVSALGCLVGERLAYVFIMSMRSLLRKHSLLGILMTCSNDNNMLQKENENQVRPGGSYNVDWVAAGGRGPEQRTTTTIPWERHLVEMADGIVDVLPLASGYSREAHGRLVFTTRPGGSLTHRYQQSLSPVVMNFVCQDATVSATRLSGPTGE
jgi:hypothetical protein